MDTSLSRRTVAKVTGVTAAGLSVASGILFGGFDVEASEEGGKGEKGEDETGGYRAGLPRPQTVTGSKLVSEAIADRRSRREFSEEPLSREVLGQLLWAVQGVTERQPLRVDLRAAPSAGATYPLDVFVVIGEPGVVGLQAGIYQYDHADHELERLKTGRFQNRLRDIAIDQEWVETAALDFVITAIDERTTDRYGIRGARRYVPMEAGHVGENLYLQAESLELATVAIGAFRDDDLRDLLGVSDVQ